MPDSLSVSSNLSVYDDLDHSISSPTSKESSSVTTPSRWKSVKHHSSAVSKKTKQECGKYWSNVFTLATLKEKLPIIGWLPNYRLNHLRSDFIAGLTVGLTVIPQGMAYAALAGLDLQYGLYSSFIGCFIYCLMGTSKDITMGPTAIMSILVSEYARDPWTHSGEDHGENTNATLAIMLAFLTGIIQILMAIFRLGFLVRFISHPVITGFTCASAIIIAGTQLNKIFGISTPRGFFRTIIAICENITETKIYDLIMGLTCMVILYLLKFAKQRWADVKAGDKTAVIISKKTLWFIATARNAIVVVVCGVIAWGISDINTEGKYLTLTKNITGGVPPFKLPDFVYKPVGTNETYYFDDMLAALNIGLLMVPLIGFLEAIAIAKSFGRKNKYKVDSQQELLTIGVSNFLSSFVSSYAITGSFGRSAVNAQCNVMTPMGGLVTGTIVLLALEFLTEAFQYIPSPALGAVIIMAVINLFDLNAIKNVAKVNLIDLFPLLVTFICCFWDVAYGIMIGIGVAIVILLLEHAMPRARSHQDGDTVTITMKKGLDFPGAEAIENKLQQQAERVGCKQIIMDCANLTNMDYSAAEAFYHGAEALKTADVALKFAGLRRSQRKILAKAGIEKYGVRFYNNVEDALADHPEKEEQPENGLCYVNEMNVDDELAIEKKIQGDSEESQGESEAPTFNVSSNNVSSRSFQFPSADATVAELHAKSDLGSVENEQISFSKF